MKLETYREKSDFNNAIVPAGTLLSFTGKNKTQIWKNEKGEFSSTAANEPGTSYFPPFPTEREDLDRIYGHTWNSEEDGETFSASFSGTVHRKADTDEVYATLHCAGSFYVSHQPFTVIGPVSPFTLTEDQGIYSHPLLSLFVSADGAVCVDGSIIGQTAPLKTASGVVRDVGPTHVAAVIAFQSSASEAVCRIYVNGKKAAEGKGRPNVGWLDTDPYIGALERNGTVSNIFNGNINIRLYMSALTDKEVADISDYYFETGQI